MIRQEIKEEIVEHVYERYLIHYPELMVYYDDIKLAHIKQDTLYHLEHLESTWPMKMDVIFLDYTEWVDTVLTSRGIETKLLEDCFIWMKEFMLSYEQDEEFSYYTSLLSQAAQLLQNEKSK
ncbi:MULTISPECIES: hypothetical protein [Pontibacillus]|uniref:Uncharacterized protein n=1 Tax=Pontibacillus chungwhensis TaxID=265426 RepID=A0ABY8V668_9BACI|nr:MULTISPECIES: hypothetical protein [Pontibacillus]MCD5322790.1 hypothetical protein [Pontibacillus sp. HN14]WIG00060.1 hypothetical protein QNI29_10510 [Pontibacillus chungwhensis]